MRVPLLMEALEVPAIVGQHSTNQAVSASQDIDIGSPAPPVFLDSDYIMAKLP